MAVVLTERVRTELMTCREIVATDGIPTPAGWAC